MTYLVIKFVAVLYAGSKQDNLPSSYLYVYLSINEPQYLQLWATIFTTMSQNIDNYEPQHWQLWATTLTTMSQNIDNYEPQHLQLLATTSPTISHNISNY